MIVSYIVLVALTTGVVEVIKRAIKSLPKGLVPLLALVVGFLLTLLANLTELSSVSILTGIAVGLSASGAYDIIKNPIKAVTKVST